MPVVGAEPKNCWQNFPLSLLGSDPCCARTRQRCSRHSTSAPGQRHWRLSGRLGRSKNLRLDSIDSMVACSSPRHWLWFYQFCGPTAQPEHKAPALNLSFGISYRTATARTLQRFYLRGCVLQTPSSPRSSAIELMKFAGFLQLTRGSKHFALTFDTLSLSLLMAGPISAAPWPPGLTSPSFLAQV